MAITSSKFNSMFDNPRIRPVVLTIAVVGLLLSVVFGGACIATQKDASQQDAGDRYSWKGDFSVLVGEIRNEFPAAFSEAEIVDAGHGWISFAGSPPDGALAAIDLFDSSRSGVSIDVRTGQVFTEVELQRAISAAQHAVYEMTEVRESITRFDSEQGRITTTVALGGNVSYSVLDELKLAGETAIADATHPEFMNNIVYSVIRSDTQSSIVLE